MVSTSDLRSTIRFLITLHTAQLINAVNSDVPGFAGVLIIAAATFVVTLFGYKIVHAYEFWSWIPCFIVFLIVLGEFAHSGKFSNLPMGVGKSEAGSVLSFAASVFGFATGWTSYASDYTCYQPRSTNRTKVFISTFCGLAFPLLFTQMLGAAVITATINDPAFADGYNNAGIGGLLAAVLFPPLGRFGQFCLVILALSIVANNCPNIYSVSLSMQVLARWTARVPRFIWTLLGTCCYIAIAIPGYSHFESVLEDFMLIIVSYTSFLHKIISAHERYSAGLLVGHLRRCLTYGAFRLQEGHCRLLSRALQQSLEITPWYCGHRCLLLRCFRSRHGHGSDMVYWTHWQTLR